MRLRGFVAVELLLIATTVSVHLIDDQGRDCGSLGQALTAAVGNSK